MKRKIIAAVLALLGAGFAWQSFAGSYEDCELVCREKFKKCIKDAEGASGREKVEASCRQEFTACLNKCDHPK
jgi:hypothetical protein